MSSLTSSAPPAANPLSSDDITPAEFKNSVRLRKNLQLKTVRAEAHAQFLHILKAFRDRLDRGPVPQGLKPAVGTGVRFRKASEYNLFILLANLVLMTARNKDTVAVSLRETAYASSRMSEGFVNLVKLAAHPTRGIVTLKKGRVPGKNGAGGTRSRIKPTAWSRALLRSLIQAETPDMIAADPAGTIVLRKTVKEKVLKPGGGHKTVKRKVAQTMFQWKLAARARKRVEGLGRTIDAVNKAYGRFTFAYTHPKTGRPGYFFPSLYAVYTDSIELGGRLYDGAGGYQCLPKSVRKSILVTVRGEGAYVPTVEYDFGGMHIRMLYHMEGINLPTAVDPYTTVVEAVGLDPKVVFAGGRGRAVRQDLKVMFLALVNGSPGTRAQIIDRADHRLFRSWYKEAEPEDRRRARVDCETRRAYWGAVGLSPSLVLQGFHTAHAPIASYFSTGCGLKLQNIDAEIAIRVILGVAASSPDAYPVLPVHDSFITTAMQGNTLRQEMIVAYRDVMWERTGKTDFDFLIPVE